MLEVQNAPTDCAHRYDGTHNVPPVGEVSESNAVCTMPYKLHYLEKAVKEISVWTQGFRD